MAAKLMVIKRKMFLKIIGKAQKLSVIKYVLLSLLIVCITVVILLVHSSNQLNSKGNQDIEELKYAPKHLPQFSEGMFKEDFEECFFQGFNHSITTLSSINECFPSSKKGGRNYEQLNKAHSYIDTLFVFTELSRQLEMETVLIEPSILFCLISPKLKSLLLKRKFASMNKTSEHVITLGAFHRYAVILEKEEAQNLMKEHGFQVEIVKRPILSWMKPQDYSNSSLVSNHVFLQKNNWTIHLVVFHERNNYLWHASFSFITDSKIPFKKSLHFTEDDAAFDNFTAISLGFKTPCLKNINIPSNPAQFLHQIATSKFIECNKTVVGSFINLSSSESISERSSLSVPHFNQRLTIALQELKLKLDLQLINFWIWSGTMLGWHRQCDVIPYTTDVDFAAWASDVDDLNELVQNFVKNEDLEIKQKMGTVDQGLEFNLNCHSLRIDLFFVYEESNGTWYAGHRPESGYFFKYHHPSINLCSAELLGYKVLVPCEAEKNIVKEYGTNWMHPVSSWSYETSIRNRGPNIFWEKSLLEKVYENF